MKIAGRAIDHIVYAVPNLEEAIYFFEKEHGLSPTIGGRHITKGTKNALLNLGMGCYLEILAIDSDNQNVIAPRWMGIDLIKEAKVTRWSLKSDHLEKDQAILRAYQKDMGVIEQGERETPEGSFLRWKMILPLAEPEIELIPFMTDWSLSSFHPTEKLSQNCSLEKIMFHSSNNEFKAQNCFNNLFENLLISNREPSAIKIEISGPNGIFIL